MATHSSILAWRIPWTEEPGGLQSIRWQRVRHNWAHTHLGLAQGLRVVNIVVAQYLFPGTEDCFQEPLFEYQNPWILKCLYVIYTHPLAFFRSSLHNTWFLLQCKWYANSCQCRVNSNLVFLKLSFFFPTTVVFSIEVGWMCRWIWIWKDDCVIGTCERREKRNAWRWDCSGWQGLLQVSCKLC